MIASSHTLVCPVWDTEPRTLGWGLMSNAWDWSRAVGKSQIQTTSMHEARNGMILDIAIDSPKAKIPDGFAYTGCDLK